MLNSFADVKNVCLRAGSLWQASGQRALRSVRAEPLRGAAPAHLMRHPRNPGAAPDRGLSS